MSCVMRHRSVTLPPMWRKHSRVLSDNRDSLEKPRRGIGRGVSRRFQKGVCAPLCISLPCRPKRFFGTRQAVIQPQLGSLCFALRPVLCRRQAAGLSPRLSGRCACRPKRARFAGTLKTTLAKSLGSRAKGFPYRSTLRSMLEAKALYGVSLPSRTGAYATTIRDKKREGQDCFVS